MAVWEGVVIPPLTGYYNIEVTATDGCRVYLGGVAIHNQWHLKTQSSYTYSNIFLDATEYYDFAVEFFNTEGSPVLVISWASPTLGIAMTPIPVSSLFHNESCDCSGTGYIGDQCTISRELFSFFPFYYYFFKILINFTTTQILMSATL